MLAIISATKDPTPMPNNLKNIPVDTWRDNRNIRMLLMEKDRKGIIRHLHQYLLSVFQSTMFGVMFANLVASFAIFVNLNKLPM